LMAAARHMSYTPGKKNANPYAYPGVSTFTKGSFQYPISQVVVIQYKNHVFQPQGGVIAGRGALR
jgi:hypothetical protein